MLYNSLEVTHSVVTVITSFPGNTPQDFATLVDLVFPGQYIPTA